jgi:hypothetical protein
VRPALNALIRAGLARPAHAGFGFGAFLGQYFTLSGGIWPGGRRWLSRVGNKRRLLLTPPAGPQSA